MKQSKQLQINSESRVIGRGGTRLGRVQQAIHDPDTGELTAFTLRNSRIRRSLKLIPAEYIKEVNPESNTVIVRLTKKDLRDMLNARPAGDNPLPVEVSLPRPATKVLQDGAWRMPED
ncbi:hypothetical protein BH23CHL2_BH23CHL2_28870 [soil metagenome]